MLFWCGNISTKIEVPRNLLKMVIYWRKAMGLFVCAVFFGRSNLETLMPMLVFWGSKLQNVASMYTVNLCLNWKVCFPKPSCKNLNLPEELLCVFGRSKIIQKDPKSLWPEPKVVCSTILIKSCSKIWYENISQINRKRYSYLKIWYAPAWLPSASWTFTEASCCFVSLGRGSGESWQPLV